MTTKLECKLDELSAAGQWEAVFDCLNMDGNSTFDLWFTRNTIKDDILLLNKHKSTTNFLEMILTLILIADHIIAFLFLYFLSMYVYKYMKFIGIKGIKRFMQSYRASLNEKTKKKTN